MRWRPGELLERLERAVEARRKIRRSTRELRAMGHEVELLQSELPELDLSQRYESIRESLPR